MKIDPMKKATKLAKRGEFRIHLPSPRIGFYVGSYPMCWAKPRNYDINKHAITDARSEVNCPRCIEILENRRLHMAYEG